MWDALIFFTLILLLCCFHLRRWNFRRIHAWPIFSVLIHNAEKGHLEHHIQANHIKFNFNVNSSQEESYKCPCCHKQLSTIYHFHFAENIKEPAMIHVCLHLSEQQKCRHRPMMCLSLQKTWNSLQRMSMSLQ